MRYLLAFILIIFFNTASISQNTTNTNFIKDISNELLLRGTAYNNLRVLCKQIGNRLSGSANMYKAEAWGVQTLQQAGADTVYKQACMVPHWVRGKQLLQVAQKNGYAFNVLALGNSVGTNIKGFTAPIIMVKNFTELEQRKAEVKGKIVFFNYKFRKDLLNGAYGDAVAYRAGGASYAAKFGALGVVVRAVTAANDNHPHTGALRYVDSLPKIPALSIGPLDADKLATLVANENLQLRYISNCTMLPDTIAHNIIGELRGTEFPNEIITIGGHLDSWDVAEGAHDDGTGVVQSIAVLETLRRLGYKPKRTIRIVLFANEENGLRGGNKYAEVAKTTNEKYIAAMESDGGGEAPKGFECGVTEAQFEKIKTWQPYFEPFNAAQLNYTKGGGGADIGPLKTAFGTAQFGFTTVGLRYFDYHHAATDVFENVHERELHMGAVLMTAMVYLIDQHGL
jgi:carboxypeptidase Q